MADAPTTTATIYFLAAADALDRPRYVGMTTQPLRDRLRRHVRRALAGEGSPKCDWIREMSARGVEITITEIEHTSNPDAEAYWIEKLIAEGADLTNAREGGLSGFMVYEDTRKRMGAASAITQNRPGHRERMGETMKVVQARPGLLDKMHAALRQSMADPAVRAKISLAATRRMARPEGRACVQGENQGSSKLKTSEVIEIRARVAAGGIEQQQLAAEFGVSKSQISSIVKRKTWRHI